MENKYDVIVIGAGSGGLVSALELASQGKKVLVLESNNTPGGVATSFIRGRFEFDVSLQGLIEYGTKENPQELYNLFERLNLDKKIKFVTVPDAYHVYLSDSKKEYKMPIGIAEYILKMEEYVPKSKESLEAFFALAKEVYEALSFFKNAKGHIDMEFLKTEFPNFTKVATYSVSTVFRALKIPKEAQKILFSCWIHFGSTESTLSFIDYASYIYSLIGFGEQIPMKRSHEISVMLAEEIKKQGGEIKYLATAKEILFEEGNIKGVKLTNNKEYYSTHIICNFSPTFVYGKMIPQEYIPKEALKLTNSRVLGARAVTVYLGLNQSPEKLGLTEYKYMIYKTLDSEKEFAYQSQKEHTNCLVTVLNKVIPNCSPKNTTIMQFTSLYFGEAFTNSLNENNYFQLKEKVATMLIHNFEETTGIILKPFIEEIEIATPVTFARYTNHPDGVIYGYKATGLDNSLPRTIREEEENYIPNLRFCGGFASLTSGYANTYFSGFVVAKKVLRDIEREKNANGN